MTIWKQEPDRTSGSALVLGAAALVLGAVVFVILAWGTLMTTRSSGHDGLPAVGGVPVDVEAVELHTFDIPTAAEIDGIAARARLASWGWVDRDRRRVHMPIEVAMELLLREEAER